MSHSDRLVRAAVTCLLETTALPPEIVDAVARHVETGDLLNVNTVSSRVNRAATAAVYYDVTFDFGDGSSSLGPRLPLLLFLRTILTSKTAASSVHRLSLTGDPRHIWRSDRWDMYIREASLPDLDAPVPPLTLDSFTVRESGRYNHLLTVSGFNDDTAANLAIISCLVINQLGYLNHLRIDSDFFRWHQFAIGLRRIADRGDMQRFTSAEFCQDLDVDVVNRAPKSIFAVCGWDNSLLAPFVAPNIESISTVMPSSVEISSHTCLSSVTKLSLRHCQVGVSFLGVLLSTTPKLRHCEYRDFVDHSMYTLPVRQQQTDYQCVEIDPIFDALQHVKHSLKCLILSESFVEDSPYFHTGCDDILNDEFHQRRGLSNLTKLHKLVIPFPLLVGWRVEPTKLMDWKDVLPHSLRHLTWTDHLTETFTCYHWDDQSLIPVTSTLLQWLRLRVPEAESVHFHLLLERAESEWPAKTRGEVEQLCARHNVECLVSKKHPDVKPERPCLTALPRGRGRGRGGRRRGATS